MIDKLNSLMKHWPKSQFPFPTVNRTNKGWELSALNGDVKAESKHLIGALNVLVQKIRAQKNCMDAFWPIAKEITAYIQDHSETIQNFEALPVFLYAVHTEKDSYVFNDPYSIVDSLTIRELRSIESQQIRQGETHKLPHNYRRLIGKALRESQRK